MNQVLKQGADMIINQTNQNELSSLLILSNWMNVFISQL